MVNNNYIVATDVVVGVDFQVNVVLKLYGFTSKVGLRMISFIQLF